jgi:acyl-CoA thioesterase-1
MSLRHRLLLFALLALPLVAFSTANLAHAQVVAIGASNTYGSASGSGGVIIQEAYPAQLEKLLRARGLNVTVKNAGVPGITAGQMLGSLDSVADSGTKVAIIDPLWNEMSRGGSRLDMERNIAEMTRRLKARGIKVITFQEWPPFPQYFNGGHPSAEGHAIVAAKLLPQVMAALRH